MRLISVAASVLFMIVFVGDMLAGSIASRDVAFTGESKYVEDAGDDGEIAMQAVAEEEMVESGDMANADMDVGAEPAEAEAVVLEEPAATEEPSGGGAPEPAVEKSGVDDSTAQDAEIAPTSTLAGTQPPPEETYGEGIGFAEPPDSPPHVSELSPTPDPNLFSAAPPTIPPTELAVERIELEGESDDAEHDEPVYAETESWDEAEVEEAPVEEVEVQESKEPLLNLAERILVLIALLSGGIAYLIRRRAG